MRRILLSAVALVAFCLVGSTALAEGPHHQARYGHGYPGQSAHRYRHQYYGPHVDVCPPARGHHSYGYGGYRVGPYVYPPRHGYGYGYGYDPYRGGFSIQGRNFGLRFDF